MPARALLVTHWSVDSDAATRLTTATFDALRADAKLGRAEGVRRAMLTYLNDVAEPVNAYPAFWGTILAHRRRRGALRRVPHR